MPVNPSQRGAPDLIIFLLSEIWLVETKATDGKLKDHQAAWLSWFAALANVRVYRVRVVNTVKLANQFVDELLELVTAST